MFLLFEPDVVRASDSVANLCLQVAFAIWTIKHAYPYVRHRVIIFCDRH